MTFAIGLRCVYCGARYGLEPLFEGCPACATPDFASGLTPEYDYAALRASLGDGPLDEPGPGIWRYRRLLPLTSAAHELSLGEGGTALVPLPRLADELGAAELWVKDESRNPTWSFKDRHAAVAVSKAFEAGARTVAIATSGNHGVSVAAYAARAGLRCIALTYPGVPDAARILMQGYGATVLLTTHEGRWVIMRAGVKERGWYPTANLTDIPTNSAYGHEGYKTIAYEVHAQLGGSVPDLVAVPTAYAEGLFGIWKGFDELTRLGQARRAPRLLACEPLGGALGAALAGGNGAIARVPRPPTVARGLGGSANAYIGVAALSASDGAVAQADDAAILAAQRDLAREGLFAEPAAATALAGLRAVRARGELPRGQRIVLVSTSGGLKNLEAARAAYPEPATVAPSLDAALEAIGR